MNHTVGCLANITVESFKKEMIHARVKFRRASYHSLSPFTNSTTGKLQASKFKGGHNC